MKSIIIASLVALAIAASPALDRTFSPKSEYVYKFDGLLLSGLPTASSDASQTLISCRTRLQAVDDRYIHLQLTDIQYSASHIPQSEQWPKIESLEQRELSDEFKELLELPFRAQIRNGLISEIQFSSEDAEWSKNAKRSILNLFSLRKSAPVDEMNQDQKDMESDKDSLFFNVHEKTMEGDCEVAYTIVQEGEKTIYTKSVNFDKCITRPETAYGLRFGSECKECEKEGQFVKPQTVYTYTFKNEKLQESEVHSVYTLNVNGQEVVKSETRAKVTFVEESKINREIKKVSGPKEEIVYSMENEKLIEQFYQQGDKAEVNPFKAIEMEQKVEQLQEIFRQIQEHEQNTPETVHLIARAVRMFRMCTIEELKKVHTTIYTKAEKKVQLVIETTLAVAGTKNTIQHLIHHFEKKSITPLRAAELLKSVQETLYPSEHIADLLIQLAQSPLSEKYEPLRQSAWLAAGSVVRGFASKTQDLPLIRPASRQTKEKYVRVFMQHFRNADSTYEKVLALKTLGNAGIDLSVYELVQIIQDPRQPLSIRTEAVDALRLLKDVMPRKIQKVLLPVYKNRQNKPELRMAALWRMMHTIPEEPVLAHIVSQMENESNQHVAAFTYNVLRQFYKSTNPCYQQLAVRCSKILLFTRYQPQEQMLSTYSQLPLFNSEWLSGVQFDFATIFEKNAFLPKEVQASFETVFGGNWNKYFAQVGFSQQNFEQVILKTLEKLSLYGKQSDELRSRRVQSGIQMLQEIVKKMNIRPRVQQTDSQNAHAVFYLRYKEMDYIVLPIDMETIDTLVEKYVRNGEFDIKSLLTFLTNDSKFELHRALFFYEAERRIPTTIGMPLTISGKMPTILSINGKVSIELEKLGARLVLDIVPTVATTHVTEMRFWYPVIEQGVKSLQSARLHTPLRFESTVELKKNTLEITHKFVVPENKKTTVSVHTRPVAFIRVPKNQDSEYVEAEEKTISHSQYQMSTEEIDRQYETFGLRINAQGNVLSQWTLPMVLMTEQDFEYTLENKNRPVEFTARVTIGNLEKTDLSEIKFDKIFEKEFDLENNESENRRQYFHKMIREIQSEQGFKNLITLKLEAPQQMYWNTELRTVCDKWIRMCKVEMDARRSPMEHENKEWTLRTELLAARPQMPSSLRQLREQPHREVQLAFNAKWGSSKKSEITVNAQLEQSTEQKKFIRNIEREYKGIPEYELLIKAARLNQVNVVSEYKLTPQSEYTFSRIFDLIKAYNFWTVSEKRVQNENRRVVLQLSVEPLSRQYMNMTIQTPEQEVELKNVRIPRVVLPTIARSAMFQQTWEKTGATCKVDQSEVSTFDNVIYRAPLTTCYSLVAKDCSEQPRFAVLAKKINKNSEELLVKVVRREEEIVVKKSDDKFLVKVDGKKVNPTELEQYNIEILGDNLIVIRLPQGEVRFDGYTVKTNMPSVASQNQLCGLCGNNDGERDNEFMTADNYETEDVEEFHRSYLLKNEECEVENDRISEKKNYRNKWNREEKKSDYESSSDYESNYDEKETEKELVKKTLIKEFSNRVCFSIEPVSECRRGLESEKTSNKKIRFTCMPRHSKNARRFLKEAREQTVAELVDFPVSFVESVKIPTACVAY
ncbi:Vitellogenin-5 [Caenorhabditis elegans]|uniref:Vitellogenin-5 n=1 Tax=Caenorhabditis elegans TaxID=6239 RepID=VIT5_CAEEL|nr:Vitellogenin-5 [Caenorhabditis elegans]P06125.2 RecName: Full=Vitellogenin-5; Flags: Precursor [Caenorhabditis elegans]CCD63027.1 Vitellogenin-5 [Caenorhabditis elegans]|eukprot:NP_508589.1 Vitellogenin-5 [Caenorhabditis elegans]